MQTTRQINEIKDSNIRHLINLSELLVTLAQTYALTTGDEKSLIFYGTVLDNAYKLRLTAETLWHEEKQYNLQ